VQFFRGDQEALPGPIRRTRRRVCTSRVHPLTFSGSDRWGSGSASLCFSAQPHIARHWHSGPVRSGVSWLLCRWPSCPTTRCARWGGERMNRWSLYMAWQPAHAHSSPNRPTHGRADVIAG